MLAGLTEEDTFSLARRAACGRRSSAGLRPIDEGPSFPQVKFSTSASVVLEPTRLDDSGRARAMAARPSSGPSPGTPRCHSASQPSMTRTDPK